MPNSKDSFSTHFPVLVQTSQQWCTGAFLCGQLADLVRLIHNGTMLVALYWAPAPVLLDMSLHSPLSNFSELPIFFHTTKGPEAPRSPAIQSYNGEQSVLECEVISFSLWSPFSFSLGWATSHMVLETGSHFLWLGVSPCLIFTNDSSPFNSGEGVTCFLILLGSCFL